jgi:hypothetical protein
MGVTVQLQGLEAHVISQIDQEGKEPSSWPIRLMPHASEQSPSAFRLGVFVFHSNQTLERAKK